MTGRLVILAALLTITTACGGSVSDSSPSAVSTADPTGVSTTSAAPTTTSEPRSVLHDDARITPTSALADPNDCKIPDVSPDGSPTASGFPRDPLGIDPSRDLRLLILPVSVEDSTFDDADLTAVTDALDITADYFADQSYGTVGLDVDIPPKESWITLPGTAESTGMANTTFGHDKTPLFRDALVAASATFDLAAYDMVAVYGSHDERFSFAQSIFDVDTPDGVVRHGVLIGGRHIGEWTLLAHEVVHAWLLAEDHYHYERQDELMMGGWDILDQSFNGNFEINPWTRWINSWITDAQVRCITSPGETAHHLETISVASDETKMIVVRLSENSVLIIDSRRDRRFIDHGWDANGSAVAVYVIDTSIPNGQAPFRWRGDLRRVDQVLTTDGVTITLLDADDTSDLVSVIVG